MSGFDQREAVTDWMTLVKVAGGEVKMYVLLNYILIDVIQLKIIEADIQIIIQILF